MTPKQIIARAEAEYSRNCFGSPTPRSLEGTERAWSGPINPREEAAARAVAAKLALAMFSVRSK